MVARKMVNKPTKIYRAAIYRRLSKEDVRKGRIESESIENQLDICRAYIANHNDIVEVEVYTDDGYTGLNYNRKDFQRMMRDVDAGKIDTIITKSLSRLGREHAETIKLFKQDFVQKGIRFIAVTDNIDFMGMISNVDIPLKVVLNDFSSMETSKNVKSAFKAKKAKGAFTGSFAPYGYKKDPLDHNHLIIDEEAAEIVRLIFRSYINGIGIRDICLMLNDMGVLSPAEYKQRNGFNYVQTRRKKKLWTYTTVRSMLSNETYIGNVVQNRDNKIAYNLDKKVRLPKEEWIVVENKHEPIISREDFELVQKILAEHWHSRDTSKDDVTKYMGILKCGDCGYSMSKSKRSSGLIFRCGSYARFGVKMCTSHWITEKELDEIVLTEINRVIREAIDEEKIIKQTRNNIKKIEQMVNGEKNRYENALMNLEGRLRRMVINLSNEVISEEDFKIFKENYLEEKKDIEEKIKGLQTRSGNDIIYLEEYQNWIDSFIQYKGLTEITRDVLINLISEIQFFETEDELRVRIRFRFKKPYQD